MSLKKKIKRRLKSDTCWACQYKSSFDSYKRKLPRCQKGFDGIKWTTLTGYHAASGGLFQMNALISLSVCLRGMHSVDCLGFPQLLESRGLVPWAESLLSFLSTAFQRKRDHRRGDSGKFWVLAQIAGQKEFPLPQRQANKTGKRDFPLYFCTLWNTLFFQGHCYGNSLISAPREGEHSEKLLSKCDFFWLLTSLPILW